MAPTTKAAEAGRVAGRRGTGAVESAAGKGAPVAGRRPTKGKRGTRVAASGTPRAAKKGSAKAVRRPTASAKAANGRIKLVKGRSAKAAAKAPPAHPPRVVKIRELNAQGKCGVGTSVVHLFRVDEVANGSSAVHLVFYDRHGWYCEHGRSCPAVEDVRKFGGSHLARAI